MLAVGFAFAITSNDRAEAATPTFVQTAERTITSGNTNSVAFASANAAADLIVAYVIWSNTNTVTLSDTKGNVYAPAGAATTWDNGIWSAQLFYAKNILAGANTVTVKYATAVNQWGLLYIHEYSGLDLLNPLDVTAAGAGTGTAMSTTAATTTGPNDLIFAGGASTATVTAPGTGFTARSRVDDNLTEDRIVGSAGSYSATATQNSSAWVLQLAAFKAASTDVTPPSAPTSLAATATASDPGAAHLDRVDRCRRSRRLQRVPVDHRRFHRRGRQQDRDQHHAGVHRPGREHRHVLLPGQRL